VSRPRQFVLRMVLFLALCAGALSLVAAPLLTAFMTSPVLNGVILAVLILGILFNFRQVMSLWPEIDWIEAFRQNREVVSGRRPRLLAPMAAMIGERRGRLSLSAPALRSLLDGIASRLDESRDLSRYAIGLLVFLGLLGTFWGLLQTVGSISDIIRSLSVDGGDPARVFGDLKRGLEVPLGGMGTAFSSSLFGLGGSLVLGFLDLQAGQAQNRFFNELEEYLSASTRLGSAPGMLDGEATVPAYVQSLLEQTAESLDALQRLLGRSEEGRSAANASILALSEKIAALTDQMRAEQQLMLRLAETQNELKPVLGRLSDQLGRFSSGGLAGGGLDEATRGHIRNLELYVARIAEEQAAGREEIIRQVRSDFRFLARTIAAVAEDGDASR
jgi:hypothetical protein